MNLNSTVELNAGGPGSGRKPSYAKGLNKWKSPEKERELAHKDPKQMKLPLKAVEETVEREGIYPQMRSNNEGTEPPQTGAYSKNKNPKSKYFPDLKSGGPGSGRHKETWNRNNYKWIHTTRGTFSAHDLEHYELMDKHGISQNAYDRVDRGSAGYDKNSKVLTVVGHNRTIIPKEVADHFTKNFNISPKKIRYESSPGADQLERMRVRASKKKMSAGGPGSGRRPTEVLEHHGWKTAGYHFQHGVTYEHPLYRGHFISINQHNDNWKHEHWSDKIKRGQGGDRLETHLQQFHGMKAYADWGEPTAGGMSHAHLDSKLVFHPPSLKNPDRIPTDDPGEKNDRFLDVTKRKSKDTHKERMKLLKRSAPGGLPPQIPATTTLVAPHTATYLPGMFGKAVRTRPISPGKTRFISRSY